MSNSGDLEECKKEIRSVLISFQEGCSLSEFRGTYKGLIGRTLPAAEFGFTTDIDFLYSMPDVVKIMQTRIGGYHLAGIADESVKHIKRMVSKQKPTNSESSQAPPANLTKGQFSQKRKTYKFSKSFDVPPRFAKLNRIQEPLSQNTVPKETKLPSSNHTDSQRTVLKEFKSLSMDRLNNNLEKESKLHSTQTVNSQLSTELSLRETLYQTSLLDASLKEKLISLLQKLHNEIALDDLLSEFRRMFDKSLSVSLYGFNSVEECIKSISELDIVKKNKVDFVVLRSELQHVSEKENTQEVPSGLDTIPPPKMPPAVSCDNGNINLYQRKAPALKKSTLKKKLQQVAEKYPEGIYASIFPDCFEAVTSESLNFLDHGYWCLSDLIDDVPDILIRKPVAGSRKDYIIFPAKSGNDVTTSVDHIVINLKKILEAYPEGIKINDILHVYNINTKTMLHVEDLGFDDLPSFLASIKNSIPLQFGFMDGEKSVHLKLNGATEDFYREPPTQEVTSESQIFYTSNRYGYLNDTIDDLPDVFIKKPVVGSKTDDIIHPSKSRVDGEKSMHLKISDTVENICREPPTQNPLQDIPSDAVLPQFVHYKHRALPDNFDYEIFVPAYVSSVVHAGELYIHLTDEVMDHFIKITDAIESLYNSSKSDSYKMKSIHIKDGACCCAKWPVDNHWYRVQILSVFSIEKVMVQYVDYGTTDTIPVEYLRYLKKDFIDDPMQAIKCRLSYIRPPNNAESWDEQKVRNRILSLVGYDKNVMAKFQRQKSGDRYSVLLCDTRTDDDIFITDVLVDEGLAEYDIMTDFNQTIPACVSSEPKINVESPHNLNPLQALQAQYFLKAFAAVAPSFAQNEYYITLLRQVSMYCPSTDPVQQNVGMPLIDPVAPLGLNRLTNSNAVSNTDPTDATVLNRGVNESRSNVENIGVENTSINQKVDNEIFEEDNEEAFQKFCQKFASKQYVKKVHNKGKENTVNIYFSFPGQQME